MVAMATSLSISLPKSNVLTIETQLSQEDHVADKGFIISEETTEEIK